MKKETIVLISVLIIIGIAINLENISAQQNTVCCSKTKTGALCQNVPVDECAAGAQQVPTACESTSFCQAGTCYDSTEGTCLDNTPQLVCNNEGGVWSLEEPPQCSLGCCVLGDQTKFTSAQQCSLNHQGP